MKKNTASQVIGAQLVSATDGSAFTGSVTAYVTGDGGTQAVGSVGSGACTHEGNGFHTYAPAQAETNYDHIAFTFIGTGAVPATVQVYTNFPQTGDAFGLIGTAGAGLTNINLPDQTMNITGNITGNLSGSVGSVTGAVGSVTGNVGGNVTGSVGSVTGGINTGSGTIQTLDALDTAQDTQHSTTQSRLPAALVGGRMDSDMTAISGDTVAADNLEASMETLVVGAATGGTTSTVTSAVTGHGDDTFIGKVLIFRTGALQYEAGAITDYVSATGEFTFAANTWTTSPTTETFVIV